MRKRPPKANPRFLEQLRQELREHYPTLHVVEEAPVRIRGMLPIVSPVGHVLDRWAIEVTLSAKFPRELPIVCELDDRIPWHEDFHVEKDGRACVLLPDERFRVFPEDGSFLDYLRGPILSFFLGQSLVALGEGWPFGEWGHGKEGVWQFYQELLGTEDREEIGRYLRTLSKRHYKGHLDCPCGSGSRVRDCHREEVLKLRQQVPARTAEIALEKLELQAGRVRRR